MMADNVKRLAWFEENPLRRWRRKAKVSIRKLARVMELSTQAIAQWEHGLTAPNRQNMKALAHLMKDPKLDGKWDRWMERAPQERL